MAGKIIEVIVLLLGLVLTAVIVVSIPLKSYNEYKDYLAQIEAQNEANKQQAIKPVLDSITAELKDGITYFANDMAEARPEHFIVTANYTKEGEEPWSEPIEEDDFSIKAPADFYSKGGEITVTYKGVSTVVSIALEPVVLEAINITVNPYTIKYQVGSTFDASGMIVTAVYNDGSSKILADDQYTVDEKVLGLSDTAVAVGFTDGEITKTADVAIGVCEILDNGAVESIVIVDGAIVNAGDVIANASMEVNAVYESGNRKPLTSDEYTVGGTVGAVEFGKMYELTVSYNADTSKTAKTNVVVRQTVQGEDGEIVGGVTKTETEYKVIDGVITALDNTVTFAGNFAATVLKGEDASLTLTINSAAQTVGNITVRCSNSYNVYANGSNADGGYMMQPLQINTILDLTVNGKEVQVPATVILRGCGPYESYAPLYGIYYEFTFEDVQLDAGVNKVKFDFKRSTTGAVNCWGESPSTLNIDYVHFDTLGSEIPDEYTITGIEISEGFVPEYGQRFDEVNIPVIAVLDNGTKIGISKELYDIEISGGKEGDEVFKFGKYTVTATMKDDPSMKASIEVEVAEFEHFVVLTAGVEIVDGRVLYVFTGESVGYEADDIVFFDGTTIYPITIEFGETTFRFYVDVTDTGYGTTYWPHLRLDGVNYENGENKNGDVFGSGIKFTDGQYVTNGGKVYTITTQYSMPTLVVTKAADIPDVPVNPDVTYDANIDNSYVSDKVLVDTLVFGSEGTDTNGQDKNGEYPGGIGNLDAVNAYVTYTFTLETAGKVDFIWNIAGSQWNGSGNDGLANAADHMTVILNGVVVDMNGIALPAGDGVNTDAWWNIQKVVIKDVELDAGTYTFSCLINTKGAGLNAGAMEIYSSTATVHVHTEEEIPAVAADCTKPGSTAGVKCSECGEILVAPEVVPKKAHTEEEIPAVAPDCTTPGLSAGVKCSACGEIITAQTSVPEKGHEFDDEYDADCNNGCGFVRDVECNHSFTGPILEGASGFYQKCDNENCSETKSVKAPVADSYTAAVDNSFASNKGNVLNLVFSVGGAWGINTSGSHKVEVDNGSPASGAIGGLDKAGQYVYYEFVTDKDGTVDIIWSIAGSNYNSSTKGNDGLADMAAHMTITIDGKPVDVSGIALPAEGDYPWWNLQNLVLKDVVLEAGVHTFKCDITAAGGLNIGSMTINSSKEVSVRSADITNAKVSVEGDKVYYVFTLNHSGFTADEIKFWHNSTTSYDVASFETVDGVTTLKIDVTDLPVGTQIDPHLSFAGVNYVNSENKNGDVRDGSLVYEQGSIQANGKCYMIFTNYSMPSLSICENYMKIQGADIYEEDGKLYYTLTYLIGNYDPAAFEFFDGNTIYEYEGYDVDGGLVTFKFNLTDKAAGYALWPHLRVNGANWDGANNTSSSNGDVKVSVTTETITFNGKTYTLKAQYSMPTVVVA